MKKILTKIKNNFLKYNLISIAVFILINIILYLFNLRFRIWFIVTIALILLLSFFIGFILWSLKQSRLWKTVVILFTIFSIILCILIAPFFIEILDSFTEHVTTLKGKTYVAVVRKSFDNDVDVAYYNRYGPLLVGIKERVNGYFDNVDPFSDPNYTGHGEYIFYDDNGKIIYETETDNYNKNARPKKISSEEEAAKQEKEAIAKQEVLYEKKFDNEIIKICKADSVMPQNMAVNVKVSKNGGKSFKVVSEDFPIVSLEAKFKFLNENQGFLISTGNIWLDGHSNDVYVTNDGGKTFTPAKFNYTHEGIQFITIEKLPYLKNNTLHLKCSMYAPKGDGTGYEDVPLDFISTDNGLTWNLSE